MPDTDHPGILRRYLGDLRHTISRDRNQSLIEEVMVDPRGRMFSVQTARQAVLPTTGAGQVVRWRPSVPGRIPLSRAHVLTGTALLAILVVAALVRLWEVGTTGFRGDEAVYAGQAAVISGSDEMARYFVLISRGNSNFLLYQYVLSFAYLVFGVSDVLARVVSALFSTFAVLITFELGRTLYGKRAGLMAALLLAVSSYSVALGRLALLDSTIVFFFTLAMLCAAKWSQSRNPAWLYAFAAASALAIQAKVTGGLVLPIFTVHLLVTHQYTSLNTRRVIIASIVFLAFFTPVFAQMAVNGDQIVAALSDSTGRVSRVPWDYYLSTLAGYEGYPLLGLWAAGLLLAIKNRTSGDLLCIAWILGVLLFFQGYPLKAFNYLLPIVPGLSLLAGRALASLSSFRFGPDPSIRSKLQAVAAVALAAAVIGWSIPPLKATLHADEYVGLKGAGYWLASNTPPDAGVMTMSQGSAQYALAFYGKRDSYPFGRFRLATVLPGGTVLSPRPAAKGAPTDWLTYWPPLLIQDRTVSYLVYYTKAGDDPPDDPIVRTSTETKFRNLIEQYDGQLVHAVYYNHEPRAWIYKVGRLLPKPKLDFSLEGDLLRVEGRGFLMNSSVTLSYHQVPITTQPTDRDGSFSLTLPSPKYPRPSYFLAAVDKGGNRASSTGKHIWGTDEDGLVPFRVSLSGLGW